jgi:hypothetical protein
MSPHHLLAIVVALCSYATFGCAGPKYYFAKPAEYVEMPDELPKDQARVVFLRSPNVHPDVNVHIVNRDGTYLGESLPGGYFYVDVKPGRQLFISLARNTAPLDATLEAGKIYFVEVAMHYVFAPKQYVRLYPVSQRLANWNELPGWLAKYDYSIVDPQSGQAWLDKHQTKYDRRIRNAERAMMRMDGEDRVERTLLAGDGRASLDVNKW